MLRYLVEGVRDYYYKQGALLHGSNAEPEGFKLFLASGDLNLDSYF